MPQVTFQYFKQYGFKGVYLLPIYLKFEPWMLFKIHMSKIMLLRRKITGQDWWLIEAVMHRPVAMGGAMGPFSVTSGLCPITRPWDPSLLLTPSPILIHDLGEFNIDICAIWLKIAQITRICAKSRRVFITSFSVMDL